MVNLGFWSKQKQKILNDLKMLSDDVDLTEENDKINSYFARQIKPKDFMGEHNDEIRFEKSFEMNCILLSEYTNKPIREMMTKEYFTLLNYRNEQIRKTKGHGRKSHKT